MINEKMSLDIVCVNNYFMDVEGTKDVKRLINLLAITDQFIP